MHYGNHQQGNLVRSIGDQLIANHVKTKWPSREVWPTVPLVREGNQTADRVQDLFTDSSCRCRAVIGNELPNVRDVLRSSGV